MKLPKQVQRYCPYCRAKTLHKLIVVRPTKKKRTLSKGQRRFLRKLRGYGGFPRPKPGKSAKYKGKLTKRVDIRYQCSQCKRMHARKRGKRAKKVEVE